MRSQQHLRDRNANLNIWFYKRDYEAHADAEDGTRSTRLAWASKLLASWSFRRASHNRQPLRKKMTTGQPENYLYASCYEEWSEHIKNMFRPRGEHHFRTPNLIILLMSLACTTSLWLICRFRRSNIASFRGTLHSSATCSISSNRKLPQEPWPAWFSKPLCSSLIALSTGFHRPITLSAPSAA